MSECDFCCLPGACWLYVPQERALVALMSDEGVVTPLSNGGRWRACHTCADLVDTNDMAGLVARCLFSFRDIGMPIPDGGPDLEHLAMVVMTNFATVLVGRPTKEPIPGSTT
ncbi:MULTISPECIES: hypothetical protein [Streptomyces]|uniref:hypothetical protein n=1 Tax=Streptomyces TaxID=1883 RepID=UPI00226E5D58|nr:MULTISPECIES: hypothetical protein [unclassified Streptomyces]MCY0921683.1 hypothetical protein [Streptomyces sp. H27-G5]MCY0944016.1 hypothetical protein [Streptomyces sp. H34-AA3]MCY0956264.1 hypothetical protein [Streptomyces sp. H27-H5]MCZ4082284.1 hypothetical protein [Streptomyces sp. H34-S5]